MRDDGRARPDPQAPAAVTLGVEQLDGPVEVLDAGRDVAHERGRRGEDHKSLDPRRLVVLGVGKLEQLAPDLRDVLHLARLQVEGREAPEDGQLLRHPTRGGRQGERVAVQVLDPVRVALDGHQQSRERKSQRDRLVRRLHPGVARREEVEEILGEPDRRVVPAARVVQRPDRIEHRLEPNEITRLDVVPPGDEDVVEVGSEFVDRGRPLAPSHPFVHPDGKVGEVLCVGAPGGGREVGILLELLAGELMDRLQHRKPLVCAAIDGAQQTLVDE